MSPRTLIAGFGNVLRGDDGFGVEVVRSLRARGAACEDVELLDVGIGGLHLAQALLTGYERLIILDAMRRGGEPGSVYVLEVEGVEPATEVDLHLTVPSQALAVAQALGVLPPRAFLVGCEPVEVDELCTELSPPVRAAVDLALRRIQDLLRAETAEPMRGLHER